MKLRFSETMAGVLHRPRLGPWPIQFTVTARGRSVLDMLTGRPARLEGTITVGDIVRRVPTAGTIAIRLAVGREIVYELAFRDADGADYRLQGRKDLSVFRPVHSATVMSGALYRDDEELGRLDMSFALRDLPSFVRSMVAA